MMRSGCVGVVAAMISAVWLSGCATKSTLTVQNDAPYPVEVGFIPLRSGREVRGDVIPPGGTKSTPVEIGSGASELLPFYVMPQPPRSPGRGLRWIGVEPPGPYVVRISDDGAATVFTRIEDGREIGSGSGRIRVRGSYMEPTPREWKE